MKPWNPQDYDPSPLRNLDRELVLHALVYAAMVAFFVVVFLAVGR